MSFTSRCLIELSLNDLRMSANQLMKTERNKAVTVCRKKIVREVDMCAFVQIIWLLYLCCVNWWIIVWTIVWTSNVLMEFQPQISHLNMHAQNLNDWIILCISQFAFRRCSAKDTKTKTKAEWKRNKKWREKQHVWPIFDASYIIASRAFKLHDDMPLICFSFIEQLSATEKERAREKWHTQSISRPKVMKCFYKFIIFSIPDTLWSGFFLLVAFNWQLSVFGAKKFSL